MITFVVKYAIFCKSINIKLKSNRLSSPPSKVKDKNTIIEPFLSFMFSAGRIITILSVPILLGSSRSTGEVIDKIVPISRSFKQMLSDVREQVITPDSAQRQFVAIGALLRSNFPADSVQCQLDTSMVFPLRGLSKRAIGGNGTAIGYRPKGFNLFDNTVRGSHPAHDLFIHDMNDDSQDDYTQRPVDVLAMTGGVIIATETNWDTASVFRGGNYVWLYDPCRQGLFYFAHNKVVSVQQGELVRAGDKLGEVGRTGFNAYKRRSHTHLHLMYLKIQPDGLPTPQNTFTWLINAKQSSE